MEQAKLLGLLLDGSSSLVGLKDLNHRYLYANPELESLYGVTHGALIGNSSEAYVLPQHVAEIHAKEDAIIHDGKPAHFIERLIIRGRPHIWETIRFPFRDLNGKLAGSGFVAIDIPEGSAPTDKQRDLLLRAREQTVLHSSPPPPSQKTKPGLGQLIWRSTYESGNPTLDRQHRELFDLSNRILRAVVTDVPKIEILQLMTTLMAELSQHFRDEESIMQQVGYTHVREHHDIHVLLHNEATTLIQKFTRDRLHVEALYRYLAHDMIARHFLDSDRDFFAFIDPNFPVEP